MNEEIPDPVAIRGHAAGGLATNLAAGIRATLFLRVTASAFRADAGQLIALALVSLAVDFASAVALSGVDGTIDAGALPSALLWIPLVLLAGHLGARVTKDARYTLLVPVLAGSMGIVFSILSTALWLGLKLEWPTALQLYGGLYRLLFIWWALASWLAVRRLAGPETRHGYAAAWILAAVFLLPAYFFPPDPLWISVESDEPAQESTFSEQALYAQPDLLFDAEEKLQPQRPGVEDLYFVAFAPYASQDVFMKEAKTVTGIMDERFGTTGRSIALISHPSLLDRYPIATLTSLRDVLQAIGERIDPEEDVVMLHLTSHGSQDHELAVEFPPLDLQSIRPQDLRAALDDAGIKWRIVVVSACYSGGFIGPLKDERTMVVTASDARHTSFGCGDAFDFTWFSQAFYDEALRKTRNFEEAFAMAKEAIKVREKKEGMEASNPQLYVGDAMKNKLARMQKQWAEDARAK
ncbi:MAG TPA: C13 family peptidase [Burkholderiales bacterium]|nr:C13 family peptidase [Burkholderiales bacterium]